MAFATIMFCSEVPPRILSVTGVSEDSVVGQMWAHLALIDVLSVKVQKSEPFCSDKHIWRGENLAPTCPACGTCRGAICRRSRLVPAERSVSGPESSVVFSCVGHSEVEKKFL